jgi:hypothetical protein
MSWRHIMFFIDRPAGLERDVLKKVADLAHGLHAEVELFDCVFDATVSDAEKVQRAVDDRCRELDAVVRFLHKYSVHSRITVHWAHPPQEGLAWQLQRQPPDLLVIQAKGHGDDRVIESAPCPVWVIRNARPNRGGHVIAAVEPESTDEPTLLVSRAMCMPLQIGCAGPSESTHEACSDVIVIDACSHEMLDATDCDLLILKRVPVTPRAQRIYLGALRQITKAGSRGDDIMRGLQKRSADP